MDRVPVSSSNLVSVGYEPASETLEVEFRHGVYQYYNVPQIVYEQLMHAPSIGSFFSTNIRNAFAYSRV